MLNVNFKKENSENNKISDILINPANYRRNLNKTRAKLQRLHKNSLCLLNQIIRNTDQELKIYKKRLSKNKELLNDNNAFDLIFLIKQLNNAIPKMYFDINDPNNDTLYITQTIFNILKNYKLFFFFFSHYKIDDKSILKIIPLMFYEFYPKDSYIFKEGDNTTKLYFILKGKVSFRKKVNLLEYDTPQEVEQYTLGEGRFFGEWNLVYNRKSKLSALCLENAHIIFIGKDTFQRFIQEKFTKIESDVKETLINILNKYLTMPFVKIERFVLSESKLLFFKKNEIIYNEGDENKHLYIIYRGEANLIKNITQGEKHSIINSLEDINIEKIQKKAKKLDYKEILKKPLTKSNSLNPSELELLLNKNNYQVVATLGKGSMGGLEIVTGVTNFKYSLISNSSFASVYKINLKALNGHLKECMINLLPLFIELEDKIHTQIDSIKYIDNNIIPYNCQKYKNKNKNIGALDITENDNIFTKQIQKIEKKFDINEGGFIKMNEHNYNLHKQRNILKDQLKENHIKDQKIDLFVRKYEEAQRAKLKYKKVRMIHSAKRTESEGRKIINRNNSSIFSKKRPLTSYAHGGKFNSTITKGGNENNNSSTCNNISKTALKNNSQIIMNTKKNYNLFLKEEIMEMRKMSKKKRSQYRSLFRLPKKKLTVNRIKQSLSIDSRDLVKKVLIKNNSVSCIKQYDELDYKTSNRSNNEVKGFELNRKNINEGKNKYKPNKYVEENKKMNFYDTGDFNMPLFIQLGHNK